MVLALILSERCRAEQTTASVISIHEHATIRGKSSRTNGTESTIQICVLAQEHEHGNWRKGL